MLLSNKSCYYQRNHVIIKEIMLLSNTSCYYKHLNLLSLHFISYYYSLAQPSLSVAQLVEHSHALGPGFKFRSEKKFLAYFRGFQRGDLEYDNCFRAAYIALRVKVFFE